MSFFLFSIGLSQFAKFTDPIMRRNEEAVRLRP